MARVVAAGYPHHIVQRGNRRQQIFFTDNDYLTYIGLMSEWCGRCGVDVWCYCLMPNHTHLIVVPGKAETLRTAIGEAHRRYSRMINFREGWRGYLWQGRFLSFIMDENHLLAAARYIELNPVRAHLVDNPGDYRWSSYKAHLKAADDTLVKVAPLLSMAGPWDVFIQQPISKDVMKRIKQHERTGRPLGDDTFIERLECETGRSLQKMKPGPKRPQTT